jgi:hypothetical protein
MKIIPQENLLNRRIVYSGALPPMLQNSGAVKILKEKVVTLMMSL